MIAQWIDAARPHAALIMVAAPLAAAALALLAPRARIAWAVAAIGAIFAASVGFDFAARVVTANLSGGDGVGVYCAALISGCAAPVMLGAGALLKDWRPRVGPFALALALCVSGGWTGAVLAPDLLGVFLAAEVGWLASVGLAALSGDRDRGALNGVLRMLSAGAISSALFLLGLGLIGAGAGTLQLAALAEVQIEAPGMAGAGIALAMAGLAMKAGVAPLHFWAAAVYGRAGGFAILAVGVLGMVGALSALVRIAAFALPAPAIGAGLAMGLGILGAASALIGSLQAAGASDLRRLIGYAGAAQAGSTLISIALGSTAGFAAALVQLFALTAGGLVLFSGAAMLGGASALTGAGRAWPARAADQRGDGLGRPEHHERAADYRFSRPLALDRSGCRRRLVVGCGRCGRGLAGGRILWRALDRANLSAPRRSRGGGRRMWRFGVGAGLAGGLRGDFAWRRARPVAGRGRSGGGAIVG